MATSTTTTASAVCDIIDVGIKKPRLTQLCLFLPAMTAPELLQRTKDYASSPENYLKKVLGHEVFDERRDLLSLSDAHNSIDRDIYGDGTHKSHFERHIAKLLNKDHGLFFLTGVQAQCIACKIYCEAASNNRVAWHQSSHLESAEQRAFESLYGLERTFLGSNPNELPTMADVKELTQLSKDKLPAVLLIEVPNRVLGCKTYTYDELVEISSLCKEAGVKLHMDGARLWEIESYYQQTAGKSFAELSELFDSVYVSFYKGLGGATGAMLCSKDDSFMSEAKTWQRRAGGNAFTLMFEVIDDERGYNENIGTFASKKAKMVEVVAGISEATSKFSSPDGQSIVSFVPPIPTCCQIHTHLHGYTAEQLYAARDKVQEKSGVQVFNRLRPKQTVDEMMKAAAKENVKIGEQTETEEEAKHHFMEWMIRGETEGLDTSVFVDGWTALCEELKSADVEKLA